VRVIAIAIQDTTNLNGWIWSETASVDVDGKRSGALYDTEIVGDLREVMYACGRRLQWTEQYDANDVEYSVKASRQNDSCDVVSLCVCVWVCECVCV
jgi:hypothetical protein